MGTFKMIEVLLYFFNCPCPYIRENERFVVEEVPMHQITHLEASYIRENERFVVEEVPMHQITPLEA